MPINIIKIHTYSPRVHAPYLSRDPTRGYLMGSDPVIVVANSVYRHDQSIDLEEFMIQLLPYGLTEMRRRSVMSVAHLSYC